MSPLPWRPVIPRSALGIDVGLTGVRAAVLEEDGRLLGIARRTLPPGFHGDRAEQDPLAWLAAALAAGREALAGRQHVDAVGVSALGPAPILVDAALQPLTPALLFSLDRRAERERARLGVTHDHALPKLAWWREHEPALWERAAWALDATGFLVARLSGQPTMDAITREDYEHEDDPAAPTLPAAVDPTAVVGGLTATVAAGLGLPAGTPVAAGTYDAFADVAATGVREPGDAVVLLGSTLIICVALAEPIEWPGLALSRYPGEGVLLGGWTAAAGSVIEWCERELGSATEEVAGIEPGAGGLVALPYLAGERTPVWDSAARGVLLGLTLRTRRAEVQRALVDAVALSARDHLERLRAADLAPDFWHAGGGGTHNEAWLRATCDALGAPLEVTSHAGEAVGPAVLALRAIGADPVLETEREVRPDSARSARFDLLYGVYRELYPALSGVMGRLGELEGAA